VGDFGSVGVARAAGPKSGGGVAELDEWESGGDSVRTVGVRGDWEGGGAVSCCARWIYWGGWLRGGFPPIQDSSTSTEKLTCTDLYPA